jgi:hypothetical protein
MIGHMRNLDQLLFHSVKGIWVDPRCWIACGWLGGPVGDPSGKARKVEPISEDGKTRAKKPRK